MKMVEKREKHREKPKPELPSYIGHLSLGCPKNSLHVQRFLLYFEIVLFV